jgi:hypothetical protein
VVFSSDMRVLLIQSMEIAANKLQSLKPMAAGRKVSMRKSREVVQ